MNSLVDVNVLIPLVLEQHPHRAEAAGWWDDQPDQSVLFTLPVRMALLRLLSNRKLMGEGVMNPEEAWQTLHALTSDARVIVRNDAPIGLDHLWLLLVRGCAPTPNLWTDAWLAAFAEAEGLRMVTFDKGFCRFSLSNLELLPESGRG